VAARTIDMKLPQADSGSLESRADSDLSTWDDEGGAQPMPPSRHEPPEPGHAELVQLRVRVIALENVVIALLQQNDERQLSHVRRMARHIAPRTGVTPHPLTTQAADRILQLIERASQLRTLNRV
jgi:hypothetical protein